VFLSGEREIRDTADALSEMSLRDTEILPLYARLSSAQQRRVFQPHTGRRIVLATNVAETSLTVPGIRYVIDPGTARISRYSARLKVQRLPIERISQASADQRKGRCGRIADGICIRLYSEDDFLARPRFTDPEILRTTLASVLLQMAALKLGDITDFPFLDPPDARQVRDGTELVQQLRAVEPDDAARGAGFGRKGSPGKGSRGKGSRGKGSRGTRLTPTGRTLARLPIDPRFGRMIVEADRNSCLDEVLVIAAALSIPDPRQRPADAQHGADLSHARFGDDDSDFVAYLNLWRYLRQQQRERSSNQFRKMCKAEHLHHLRVREWQDLHAQLRKVTGDLGMRRTDTPAEPAAIHVSLLAGLLSHVGLKDGDRREYRGARGARFAIQPGSVLFTQSPQWVMAAELVETTRLWGRTCARIRPEWAERLGEHLVARTYSEPHWEAKRGGVVAYEKVSLYGVPLVASRKVDYARIDPEHSRELFIRHALVDGQWRTHHTFWHDNQRRLADVETLEHKTRRRDVLVDDETLFAFYEARVGHEVVSARHFDSWWKSTKPEQPHLLDLPWSLLTGDAEPRVEEDFPDRWFLPTRGHQGELALALSYRFEPGTASDGVVVQVPLTVLNRVNADDFDWHVPGLRQERVTELLRSLPKDLRRRLVPVPDTARAVLSRIAPSDGPLLDVLERELRRTTGVDVPRDAWRHDRLPDHLRVTFRVEDSHGRDLGMDTDLAALQRRLAPRLRTELADAAGIEREGLREWTFGTLPRTFVRQRHGHTAEGFPTLVDEGDSVAIRVLGSAGEQRTAMWTGTRRLLLLNAGAPVAQAHRRLDDATKLALTANPHGSVAALLGDALSCAVDELLVRHGGPVWDEEAFGTLLVAVRAELADTLLEILTVVARILPAAADVDGRLRGIDLPALQPALADLRAQRERLVHPGFVTAKSARRLPDVARYLQGMQRRLDTLARDPARDRERMDRVADIQQAHRRLLDGLSPARRAEPGLREIPWMIEELRVSEFAQGIGTAYRVSPERILRVMDDLAAL
jgi:ATP-dependent helicase HrpA